MKLKHKLSLLGLASVSALAGLTPLALSSCSKNNNENKVINHVTQSSDDIKYGLNAKTYSDIKNNYTVKFQDQMISKGIKKNSEIWNNQMSQLNTALNAFDEISQNSPMSYTDLTNGVIDYARKTHGLTLRRTTTANFNDIEEEFQGAVEAFKDYAQHQHLPTSQIKQIVDSATSSYKQKLADLEHEGYKQNDPYGALLKVRSDLFDFFNAGNAVIAKIAGYTKLANYQNQYVFSYKKNTNSAYIENILSKQLTIGQDMTNVFDEIFEIYDNERGVKVDHFDPAAIPGYTITPVYQGIEINKDSNQSEIKFSLEILSNNYKNTNDDAKIMATAKKLTIPKDKQHFLAEMVKLVKSKSKGEPIITNAFFDLYDKVNESHVAFCGPSAEQENLINVYFNSENKEHVSFVFPTANERTRYESFFTGEYTNDVHYLQLNDLADTGLQISDGKTLVYLADVIKSVEAKQKIDNFDPSTLSFVEKFVYYCNVEGVSTIKDRTTHRVSTNISINYRNTQSKKESSYIVKNLECIGYVSTLKDFMKMSLNYNEARKVYEIYSDISSIKKYRDWDIGWSAYTCLSSAMSLFYLGYWSKQWIAEMIWFSKQQMDFSRASEYLVDKHLNKCTARLFSSVILCASNGLLIYEYQKFTRQSCSIYSKINNVLNEDYIKQLKTFMDEGKEVFVKMEGNNFEKFDQVERDQKFAEFLSHPEKQDHYRYLVDQYKRVFDKDGDFEKITKKYDISLKELNDFYKDRSFKTNPVHTWLCIGGQVVSVCLNVYLFIVTFGRQIRDLILDKKSVTIADDEVEEMIKQLADARSGAAADGLSIVVDKQVYKILTEEEAVVEMAGAIVAPK